MLESKRISLFGFPLHPMTSGEVLDQIGTFISQERRLIVANLNLHAMTVLYESADMARLLASPETLIIIDSMPLVLLSRLVDPRLNSSYRVTSLDYFDDLFAIACEKGWKIDYVGSTKEVCDQGMEILRRRHPGLDIEGVDGYFDIDDISPQSRQSDILGRLVERRGNILIAGMGMPRQEEWLQRIRSSAPHQVLIPVGAYLDYQTGAQKLPPRWLGPLCLEWLFRLATAPRRLAYRYLVEPLILMTRLLTRKHPIDDRFDRMQS